MESATTIYEIDYQEKFNPTVNSSQANIKETIEIEPFDYVTNDDQREITSKTAMVHPDIVKEKKCEYARKHMRLYRLRIKSDPVRYLAYLENERQRSRKRREKLIELKKNGKNLPSNKKNSTNLNTENFNPDRSNILVEIDSNIPENNDNLIDTINSTVVIENDENEEENEWVSYTESSSDISNDIEKSITYNRICGVVTCPSRINANLALQYYPIPTDENIRAIWLNLIKSKTKQSEIDSDSFICSLHFAPEWFELDELFDEKRLLKLAVPTIFPESQFYSQFNTQIPEVCVADLNKSKEFKDYYEWSAAKILFYESRLKKQLLIIENLNESKEIQKKRIERLIKTSRDYRLSKIAKYKEKHLNIMFEKIEDLADHLTKC